MNAGRCATVFLLCAFFALLQAAPVFVTAQTAGNINIGASGGTKGDSMCNPYFAQCPCDQIPENTPQGQKCVSSTKGSNTHACTEGVCFDTTNGFKTLGVCVAQNKCDTTKTAEGKAPQGPTDANGNPIKIGQPNLTGDNLPSSPTGGAGADKGGALSGMKIGGDANGIGTTPSVSQIASQPLGNNVNSVLEAAFSGQSLSSPGGAGFLSELQAFNPDYSIPQASFSEPYTNAVPSVSNNVPSNFGAPSSFSPSAAPAPAPAPASGFGNPAAPVAQNGVTGFGQGPQPNPLGAGANPLNNPFAAIAPGPTAGEVPQVPNPFDNGGQTNDITKAFETPAVESFAPPAGSDWASNAQPLNTPGFNDIAPLQQLAAYGFSPTSPVGELAAQVPQSGNITSQADIAASQSPISFQAGPTIENAAPALALNLNGGWADPSAGLGNVFYGDIAAINGNATDIGREFDMSNSGFQYFGPTGEQLAAQEAAAQAQLDANGNQVGSLTPTQPQVAFNGGNTAAPSDQTTGFVASDVPQPGEQIAALQQGPPETSNQILDQAQGQTSGQPQEIKATGDTKNAVASAYGYGEGSGDSPKQNLAFANQTGIQTRDQNAWGFAIKDPATAASYGLQPGDKAAISYNGNTVVATYDDAGPYVPGRSVDLNSPVSEAVGLGHDVGTVSITPVAADTPLGPVDNAVIAGTSDPFTHAALPAGSYFDTGLQDGGLPQPTFTPLPQPSPLTPSEFAYGPGEASAFNSAPLAANPAVPVETSPLANLTPSNSYGPGEASAFDNQLSGPLASAHPIGANPPEGLSGGTPGENSQVFAGATPGATPLEPAQQNVAQESPASLPASPSGVVEQGPALEQPNPTVAVEQGPSLAEPSPTTPVASGELPPAQPIAENLYPGASQNDWSQVAQQENAAQQAVQNDYVNNQLANLPLPQQLSNQDIASSFAVVPSPDNLYAGATEADWTNVAQQENVAQQAIANETGQTANVPLPQPSPLAQGNNEALAFNNEGGPVRPEGAPSPLPANPTAPVESAPLPPSNEQIAAQTGQLALEGTGGNNFNGPQNQSEAQTAIDNANAEAGKLAEEGTGGAAPGGLQNMWSSVKDSVGGYFGKIADNIQGAYSNVTGFVTGQPTGLAANTEGQPSFNPSEAPPSAVVETPSAPENAGGPSIVNAGTPGSEVSQVIAEGTPSQGTTPPAQSEGQLALEGTGGPGPSGLQNMWSSVKDSASGVWNNFTGGVQSVYTSLAGPSPTEVGSQYVAENNIPVGGTGPSESAPVIAVTSSELPPAQPIAENLYPGATAADWQQVAQNENLASNLNSNQYFADNNSSEWAQIAQQENAAKPSEYYGPEFNVGAGGELPSNNGKINYDSGSSIAKSGLEGVVAALPQAQGLTDAGKAQLADAFRRELTVDPATLHQFAPGAVVRNGDIVFPDRGTINTAALQNPQFQGNMTSIINTYEKSTLASSPYDSPSGVSEWVATFGAPETPAPAPTLPSQPASEPASSPIAGPSSVEPTPGFTGEQPGASAPPINNQISQEDAAKQANDLFNPWQGGNPLSTPGEIPRQPLPSGSYNENGQLQDNTGETNNIAPTTASVEQQIQAEAQQRVTQGALTTMTGIANKDTVSGADVTHFINAANSVSSQLPPSMRAQVAQYSSMMGSVNPSIAAVYINNSPDILSKIQSFVSRANAVLHK